MTISVWVHQRVREGVAVSTTQISDKKLGLNNAALIFDPKQGVVG